MIDRRSFLGAVLALPLVAVSKQAFADWRMKRLPDNEKEVRAWLAEIERSCGVSPIVGDSSICEETGDEYVEIVCSRSGAMFFDGTCKREKTPELAWSKWVKDFLRYQKPRGGKLHWRIRPEMTHVESQAEGYSPHETGYCVYSRLFAEKAA